MKKIMSVLFAIIIMAGAFWFYDANKPKQNKIEDLNISSLQLIVSDTEIGGTEMQGLNLYFTTDGYELNKDGYFIKPVFPDIDELKHYSLEAAISIPQKLSANGIYNLQSVVFDETGYLKTLNGNTYDIELELYKENKKINSKTYPAYLEYKE